MYRRLTLIVVLTALAACTSQQSHSQNSATPNQSTPAPAVAVASAGVEPSYAAGSIDGQVLGAGAPIAKSLVTMWAATSHAPMQLAQTRTDDQGKFTLTSMPAKGSCTWLLPAASRRRQRSPVTILPSCSSPFWAYKPHRTSSSTS